MEPEDEAQREVGELAHELAERLRTHKKAVAQLERVAKGLTGRWSDPQRVTRGLDALAQAEVELPAAIATPLRALVDHGRDWLERDRDERRGRLARELREGARQREIALVVVTRDPLELWLDPVGLSIDLERAEAEVRFGREELLRCPADGVEIFQARESALTRLERNGWTAEGFHRELRHAWSVAGKLTGAEGWIELGEVLPQLALIIQPRRWRRDPTSKNFQDYGKAQFLYELYRLRRSRALTVDGYRLALGAATGDSTRDKRRVFWVDDGEGRGAYFLTLRFVRDEEIHGTTR